LFILLEWFVEDGFILTQKHAAGTLTEENFLLINLHIYSTTYQSNTTIFITRNVYFRATCFDSLSVIFRPS